LAAIDAAIDKVVAEATGNRIHAVAACKCIVAGTA